MHIRMGFKGQELDLIQDLMTCAGLFLLYLY
jgi:hypothetical protein